MRHTTMRLCATFFYAAFASACAPEITSPPNASGTVNAPFSYQIMATRNPTEFSATVPPPAGLSVATDTGLISGIPTESGTFGVQLAARNASGEGTAELKLTIDPA